MGIHRKFSTILHQHHSRDRQVYLIHLDRPIIRSNGVRVQHYIGSTNDLERREQEHRSGPNGSPLLNLATRRGISWRIVQVWDADREVEVYLKRQKHAARFCPVCQQSNR